ncbi:MAG: branched-chain amino acid ABC transporter permease [Vicinamibacterales bacterium]
MLDQILTNGLVSGCYYALVATGFGLIYSSTKIFHIAYGATYTVAAYVCYYCVSVLAFPLPWSIVAGVLSAAALGLAMEYIVYSPLAARRAQPLVFLLSSLGLYIVSTNTVALLAGNATIGLRQESGSSYRLAGLIVTDMQLLQVVFAATLLPALAVLLRMTRLGRHVRAVRDDPVLGSVVGISERRTRLLVFAIGSALGGLAAILAALDTGINPNAGLSVLLMATVAVVVGGMQTFEGPLVGGLMLGLLRGLVIWLASARWLEAVTFAVLFVFLTVRPQGIVSRRTRLEEAMS